MNFASNSASWGLNNLLPLYNSGNLVFYGGAVPGAPSAALVAGNTALCTFIFNTTAFGAPAFSSPNDSATASFVASSVVPGANGLVTFARGTLKSAAWVSSTVYAALFTVVTNSSNFYILTKTGTSAGSGGPSGTTMAVADNTCSWAYYSASNLQNNVLADFTVGTAVGDIIIGNTSIVTTVNVTMTSFVLQMTAS